jgi:hypothetical protein
VVEMLKMEMGKSIKNSLINLFIGCHKQDRMSRTTLTLRSYLYQNLSEIMIIIAELIDAEFMEKVLKPILEDGGNKKAKKSKNNKKPDNDGAQK